MTETLPAFRGKWIRCEPVTSEKPRKTLVYNVVARDSGGVLGRVSWWPAWRRYAFFPGPNTLFEPTCLQDIALFLEQLMEIRRVARRVGA